MAEVMEGVLWPVCLNTILPPPGKRSLSWVGAHFLEIRGTSLSSPPLGQRQAQNSQLESLHET